MICGCQQIENTWYLLYTVYWELQYKVAFSSQHKHYLLKVIMLCTYRGCRNQEGREAMTPHTIFKSVLWYQSYTCTENIHTSIQEGIYNHHATVQSFVAAPVSCNCIETIKPSTVLNPKEPVIVILFSHGT